MNHETYFYASEIMDITYSINNLILYVTKYLRIIPKIQLQPIIPSAVLYLNEAPNTLCNEYSTRTDAAYVSAKFKLMYATNT